MRKKITLVYFTHAEKTASVNGGTNLTGTEHSPVPVEIGDAVRYTLDFEADNAQSGSIEYISLLDPIPEGMTLATSAGSYTTGMEWSSDGATWQDMSSNPPAGAQKATQVRWTGAALTGKAFFTVTIKSSLTMQIPFAIASEGNLIRISFPSRYIFPDSNGSSPKRRQIGRASCRERV